MKRFHAITPLKAQNDAATPLKGGTLNMSYRIRGYQLNYLKQFH